MPVDKELQKYIPIADLTAKMFGRNCEVVIHDLSHPLSSVVYAVNNHVTGRQIGQPFDHLVRRVLLSKKFENDFKANYRITTESGKEIKSSTALLRNGKGEVIGAFCVNFDVTGMRDAKAFFDEFLDIDQENIEDEVEPFENVTQIVRDLVDGILAGKDVSKLKSKEKLEYIKFMNSKGIFLIKGMIDVVAEKMKISKVTVYSYLDKIKKDRRNTEAAEAVDA